MNIFQLLKNKYNQYECNELINKPIRQKNKALEKEILLFSKALRSIGISNYFEKGNKIYAIINGIKIIFNYENEAILNSHRDIINLNSFIKDEENKPNLDRILWEDENASYNIICECIPSDFLKDTQFINSLDKYGYGKDLLKSHANFNYDKRKKIIMISSSVQGNSHILKSEVYFKFEFIIIKEKINVSVNVIDRDALYNPKDAKFKDLFFDFIGDSPEEIKKDMYKKLLPILLKEEACKMLEINSSDDVTDEKLEHLKLINY